MSALNKIPVTKKVIKPLFFVILALALVLTAFRIYMISTDYEADAYFFKHGSVMPDIFNYILAASVIIILVLFAFSKKNELHVTYGKTTVATVIMSAATGFLALVGGLYATSQLLLSEPTEEERFMEMLNANTQSSVMAERLETFALIQCFLSLGVFAYFLLTAFSIKKYSNAKSVLGIITILWHVVFLLVIYFDMSKPMNAPIRMMFQFAVLASMLYMIAEMRFLLRIPKPRLYMAISLVTILVLMSAAVPMAICALTGAFNVAHTNFIYSIQLVAMLGYVISRTVTYINQPTEVTAVDYTNEEEN